MDANKGPEIVQIGVWREELTKCLDAFEAWNHAQRKLAELEARIVALEPGTLTPGPVLDGVRSEHRDASRECEGLRKTFEGLAVGMFLVAGLPGGGPALISRLAKRDSETIAKVYAALRT